MSRLPFRVQVLREREEAIVASVNRLLADKGFDLMTVDQVAADVGIAKASLYKHFPSKEALAAAAMVRLLEHTLAVVEQQAARSEASAFERLQAIVRWALELQLAGEMPSVPSQNSTLRAELMASRVYLDLLIQLSETMGEWILHRPKATSTLRCRPRWCCTRSTPGPATRCRPSSRRVAISARRRLSIGCCPPA